MERSFVPNKRVVPVVPVSSGRRAAASQPIRNQPGTAAMEGMPRPALRGGRFMPPPGAGSFGPKVPALAVAAPAGALVTLLGFYIALHTSFAGEMLKLYGQVPFQVVAPFAIIVPLACFSPASRGNFSGRLRRGHGYC